MKKLFHLLILVFLLFLFGECFVVFMGKGHFIKYQIVKGNKTFLIEEKYQTMGGKDRYHFVINGEYVFDTFTPLHKTSLLISDIFYYEDDDIFCIYPVFRSKKIKTDVLCKKDHLFYYHTVRGQNKGLDAFVSSLSSYPSDLFIQSKEKKKKDSLSIYPEHLLKNHVIALQNYKGIYRISKKDFVENHVYFDQDVYEPTLSFSLGKYYVTALYKDENTFDELYIVDLSKNTKKTMKFPDTSLSSSFYLLDGKVYLVEEEGEKIYQINPSKRNYTRVKVLPNSSLSYQNKHYDRIEESTYYYYLYKEEDNKIYVSRVFKDNLNAVTDLFTIDTMERIKYYDDFVYFTSGSSLYYYSDQTGLKKVLSYEELSFNKSLSYFVYKKA